MAWSPRQVKSVVLRVQTHRKHLFHSLTKRSVILPLAMLMFMIGSLGLIRQLPQPNEPQNNAKSYVIKLRNAAPFPVYFDLINVEAMDNQGQGHDLGDDTNIFRNVGHDEAADMRPEDFEQVNGILNEEFNLRYEDIDPAETPRQNSQSVLRAYRLRHGQDTSRVSQRQPESRSIPMLYETPKRLHFGNLRKQFRGEKNSRQEMKMLRAKRSVEGVTENVTDIFYRANNPRTNGKELTKKVTVSTVSLVRVNKRQLGVSPQTSKDMVKVRGHRTKRSAYAAGGLTHDEPSQLSQRDGGGERRNIVLVKVHKAASSTVFSIVMRFAFSRQLDIMLPNISSVITETSPIIDPGSLLPLPKDLKFNVIANHLVYNHVQIPQFLKFPEKSYYIAIVRDPFEQFVSAFTHYLNVLKKPLFIQVALEHPRNPIRGFLDNPLKYSDFPKYESGISYINNRMSTDLGFPMWNLEMDKHNDEAINKFLEATEKRFDLVLVAELFEESLVLLRRSLNWRIKDILHLRHKDDLPVQETERLPWNTNAEFTTEDKKNHKLFAPVDYALYDYFKGVLLEKLKLQSSDFVGEVAMLKTLFKDLAAFCETAEEDSELLVAANPWSPSFSVGQADCKLMSLSVPDITELGRRIQRNRYSGQT